MNTIKKLKTATENAKDIIIFGFDPESAFIFFKWFAWVVYSTKGV
jgi:tryptophanyl-tRNA synthetase